MLNEKLERHTHIYIDWFEIHANYLRVLPSKTCASTTCEVTRGI